MNHITFKTISRIDRPIMRIIHAVEENSGQKITVYLDSKTGKPIYPVTIEQIVLGITITLESDTRVTCSFPPSVSEEVINNIIEYLKTFDDIVLAIRKLIKNEQLYFKKGE